MTKMNYFEAIRNELTSANLIEFVDKEIEALKRAKANRKPTATQIANVPLKEAITEFLYEHNGQRFTVSNLITAVEALNDLSTSKVSALVNALVAEGVVTKETIKRVSYFTIE